MKNQVLRSLCLLVVLAISGFLVPQSASGQSSVLVNPTAFYRFRISNANLGYLLTAFYQEGANAGYYFEGPMNGTSSLGIYEPPATGYTPDPREGLIPLYQWTVVQNGRPYTYLSETYSTYGSNYTYNGIKGYVFGRLQTSHTFAYSGINAPLFQLSSYYSQSYGYWNGKGALDVINGDYIEPPPNDTFVYQGDICALPAATTGNDPFIWNQPFVYNDFRLAVSFNPPPAPTCSATQEQSCYDQGGSWNPSTCRCSSPCPPRTICQ